MNKRILIFSPEIRDQEDISEIVEDELRKLKAYSSDVLIQRYSKFNEPLPANYLGHWYEVFVVFDRRFSPKEERSPEFKKTPYYKALEQSFDLSKQLCEEGEIPYLVYKGEIGRKRKAEFITGIFLLGDKINQRLEAKV